MDDVPTDGCKHVAATAESTLMKEDQLDMSPQRSGLVLVCVCPGSSSAHLSAAAHCELFEDAKITDEELHQPEFV